MTDLFKGESGAEFSEDRQYRYALWRIWDDSLPLVMFIGLNPSTANETQPDNTITKVKKIAAHNGFGGFYMMNLFGLVSSKPEALDTHLNPIGDNKEWLYKIRHKCTKVVIAWGNFKQAEKAVSLGIADVLKVASPYPIYCLAQNKNGSPKHPLYCRDETIIKEFDFNFVKNGRSKRT